MNKKLVVCILGASIVLTSCQETNVYDGSGDDGTTTLSSFDFSTSQNVKLNVTYNTKVAVPFTVYSSNPVTVITNTDGTVYSTFDASAVSLYTGYTKNDGTLSTTVELPAYAEKLYIVSPAFYVQNVLEAEVSSDGTATATESTIAAAKTRGTAPGTETSALQLRSSQKDMSNWTTPLGTFNSYTGKINYALAQTTENSNLFFTDAQISSFYSEIPKYLNVNNECGTQYLSSHDLVVTKNEKVSITMLGGNTCWNSTMGYYYYYGNQPTDVSSLKIYALFPNTQDGKWTAGSAGPTGLDRGTTVLLKYFGKNYDEAAQDEFPAGIKIGFVLSCNAWSSQTNGKFNGVQNFFSYTTPGLSSDNFYAKKKKTNMSAYYNINTAFCNYEDGTIVSFEDHFDDHNCSDVLFALKPQFPTDIPTLGEKEEKSESNIFAFEDLWPAVGDYDMNDVIVSSEYYKTMNGYNDDSYYITKEAFAFTTDQNHSNQTKLDNGLATWFTGTGLNLYVEYSTDSVNYDTLATSKYTVQEENGKTYVYLDKNVKDNLNSIYKVVIKHDYLSQVSTPTAYGCFLYRDDEGKGRWEVHIPYEKPTSNLSTYYSKFLTTDKEYAALSSENSVYYPFAIKLKGATMSNLSGLLNASNESKRIDYIYPNYSKWAKSEGKEYTDWYLQ